MGIWGRKGHFSEIIHPFIKKPDLNKICNKNQLYCKKVVALTEMFQLIKLTLAFIDRSEESSQASLILLKDVLVKPAPVYHS